MTYKTPHVIEQDPWVTIIMKYGFKRNAQNVKIALIFMKGTLQEILSHKQVREVYLSEEFNL